MRTVRLIASAMLAFAALSGNAWGCSCERNPTAEGILASASAVFTGVAQENVDLRPGHALTRFTVIESFKGRPRGETVQVGHRTGSSAACGVEFVPGETYTISAYRDDAEGILAASFCSTWMFLPHVRLSKPLIERMRELRR